MSESALSTLLLYSAKPTVRVDGEQHADVDALLRSMTMREQEGGLSSLELSYVNWRSRSDGRAGFAFEDEAIFKLGSEVKVYAGETQKPTEIFVGKVSALEISRDTEGPPRVVVVAEDGAQKARLARGIYVYEKKSLADIVKDIAGRMGCKPVVAGLDDPSSVEVQFNESDLAFLRRLLARHGADVQLVGSELQVSPRQDVRRNEIELRMDSQLARVRIVADLAHQVSEVRVTGFDPIQGKAVEGTGSGAAVGPGNGRTGKDVLTAALGKREQQTAHRLATTQSEARALAEDEFARRARRFVRVEGECEGNPALRVGSHVKLVDVSPRFDNTYYVTACTHRYDQKRGYSTEFRAESAYFGNP